MATTSGHARSLSKRGLAFTIVAVLLGVSSTARADEIIDRVLAVVAGDLITLSDVRAARELGLVDPGSATDPTRAVLSRLIDRSLVLNEVNRYAPPEPTLDAIDQRIGELRRQLGSAQTFELTLIKVGVAIEQLRDIVRGDLRIRAYLAQRFTADTPARSQTAITEWVDGLRRRAEIVDLYAPPGP
jgi:hypothetical protein